jgi:hypothetical protein
MVVFYTRDAKTHQLSFDFIQYVPDCILDEDISWWAVPGTLED